MPRPQIPVGQWGEITLRQIEGGAWRARTKFRDSDKVLREVSRQAPTKAKADRALKKALTERKRAIPGSDSTVATIVTQWLGEIDDSDLAVSTKRVYRQMANKHLSKGTLPKTPLDQLTVAAVSTFLRGVAKQSGPGAAKTVRACLRGTLDLAVEQDLIASNPVRLVSHRKPAGARKGAAPDRDTRRGLTTAERSLLLAYTDDDEWAKSHDLPDLIAFLAGTGVRIGEACAVRWSCLDLDAGTVLIDSTVVRVPKAGLAIQPFTKTGGDRLLYLSAELVKRLAARQRLHEVVFPSPLLKLRDVSNTEHALKKLFRAAGYPWMTSHTFRKTVATIMDEKGFTGREVANQFGHRRVSTSQDYYFDRHQPVTRVAEVL